jgi:hypothetical protein
MSPPRLSIKATALLAVIQAARGAVDGYERTYELSEEADELRDEDSVEVVRDQQIAAEIRHIAARLEQKLWRRLRKEQRRKR